MTRAGPWWAKGQRRWVAAALAASALASLTAWRMAASQEDREREAARSAEQRVRIVDGATVVTVDQADQRRSGIKASLAQPAVGGATVQAYATVLDAGPLLDLATAAANASAQLEAARAKLAASRGAYDRAKALYRDDQNGSLAQLQAAEAAFRSDQAAFEAAQAQLRGAEANGSLQFGPVLGAALRGPLVQGIVQRRTLLLQVAAPASQSGPPPKTLAISSGHGDVVQARYVSPSVRADPKIQGTSYYYVAPASPAFPSGLSLAAQLPTGAAHTGVAVPGSAIVVWQGQAWVYRQIGAETFRREAIVTDMPIPGGYLVRSLPPGAQLVTSGAQLLLSEETRPAKGAGEGEEDSD